MTEFTPIGALIGGATIGLSAVVLMLFMGRIAGISGIVNGLFNREPNQLLWRLLFVVGLVIGPLIASQLGFSLPQQINLSWSTVIIGGLLVGIGTNLSSGCTSGHGICGMGRFSIRSILATGIFMAVALLTVYVSRHLIGAGL